MSDRDGADPAAMLRELADTVRRIDNMRFLVGFKEKRRDELVEAVRAGIGRTDARVAFVDFDARRDPKTPIWCIRCQKDIKPGEDHLEIRLVLTSNGSWPNSLHPDDEALYDLGVLTVEGGEDRGRVPIGRDCARKHGREWCMARRATEPLIPNTMEKRKSE